MQSLFLEDQKKLKVTGATKIVSSTSTQAVVEVGETSLIVVGTGLEITKLDLDNKEVCFLGIISSLRYAHSADKKGFFKKLFK